MGEGSKKSTRTGQESVEQKAESKIVACNWCNKLPINNETFKLCKGCRKVRYCCEGCQLIDWKGGGHKTSCAGSTQGEEEAGMTYSPEVQAAIRSAMQQVTGRLEFGPGEISAHDMERAMKRFQDSQPELFQRMMAERAMHDNRLKYERTEKSSDRRCMASLVTRLDTRLQQLPGGRAAGDDLFTRELAVLSHYCFTDLHMRSSYAQGAVDFMRKILSAPAGTLDAVQTSLAWYGVTEPSLHDYVSSAMLGAGYLDWALARLRLPESTKKLLQAQGIDLATHFEHPDNKKLQAAQAQARLAAEAAKQLAATSSRDLMPVMQAGRLVTELIKQDAARTQAMQEGLLELVADVLVVSEQPLLFHRADRSAATGAVEVRSELKPLAYPATRCLQLLVDQACQRSAGVQGELLQRLLQLGVPAKLQRAVDATTGELRYAVVNAAKSVLYACSYYQQWLQRRGT